MKSAIKTGATIGIIGNTVSLAGGIGGGITIGKAVANVSDSTGLGVAAGIVGGVAICAIGSAITGKIVKSTCGKQMVDEFYGYAEDAMEMFEGYAE